MDSQTSSPSNTAQPSQRETEFRPVSGAGEETSSAAVLLTVAYCVIWVLLMGFIGLTWKRQRSLSEQMTLLESALQKRHGPDKRVD